MTDQGVTNSLDIQIATFRFDVTPPIGHSLCGGWIPPAAAVDDPLEAIGLVLLGAGQPLVLCAVDWTGLCNDSHLQWRTALAEAAGTVPDRVAVQCVHQHDAPDSTHVYFTGCAGNINTGKYNSSAVKENRQALTQRVYEAMDAASQKLHPEPIHHVAWHTHDILPLPRRDLDAGLIAKQIADRTQSIVQRNRPAFTLAWLRRLERKLPITLSALHVNAISLLHLPGEPFVEYQLRAQTLYPDRFVAAAGYGDGGPWYLPTAEAYPQGGYEVSAAFCDPRIDRQLMNGLDQLLKA